MVGRSVRQIVPSMLSAVLADRQWAGGPRAGPLTSQGPGPCLHKAGDRWFWGAW